MCSGREKRRAGPLVAPAFIVGASSLKGKGRRLVHENPNSGLRVGMLRECVLLSRSGGRPAAVLSDGSVSRALT